MADAGRPSKYSDEMLVKAQKYVKRCQNAQEMPYIEELALLLDVNDDTVVEWTRNNGEFSATIRKLKMLQKLCLKRGALEKKLHTNLWPSSC